MSAFSTRPTPCTTFSKFTRRPDTYVLLEPEEIEATVQRWNLVPLLFSLCYTLAMLPAAP